MFGANSVADDIDDTAPLWAAVHGRTVPRTAAEMAGAVASMLRLASKVIFVDPYVAAERPRQCEAVSLDRAQYEQRWRQYAGDPPECRTEWLALPRVRGIQLAFARPSRTAYGARRVARPGGNRSAPSIFRRPGCVVFEACKRG